MAEDKLFMYRGKTFDELNKMSLEELSKLFPSNIRRKINRGFTVEELKLISKFEKKEKNIKTHCRDMIILPIMVGNKISVYNGKEFIVLNIIEDHIGLRFGELVLTRKSVTHSGGGAKKTVVRK